MEPIQINIKATVEASKETAALITILADFAKKLTERSEQIGPAGAYVYTGGAPKAKKDEAAPTPEAPADPAPAEAPSADDDPFAGLEESPKAAPAAAPASPDETAKAATHEDALKAVEDARKRGIPKEMILRTLREGFGANAAADLADKDIPEFIRKMNSLKAPAAQKGAK